MTTVGNFQKYANIVRMKLITVYPIWSRPVTRYVIDKLFFICFHRSVDIRKFFAIINLILSLFFRRINTNSIVTAKKLLVFVSMKLCFEIIFLRTILPHILCPFIILVRNQCNSWIFLSTSIIHILSFFSQYDLYETNAIFILLTLLSKWRNFKETLLTDPAHLYS